MSDLPSFISTNWVAIVSVGIAIASFAYSIRTDRKITERMLADKLRPSMINLRNAIQGLEGKTQFSSPAIQHQLIGIPSLYDDMKAQSLDLVLDREARPIKRVLERIHDAWAQVENQLMPDRLNPPQDYWRKAGELLAPMNFLKDDTSELNTLVLDWLKRHP